MKFDLTHALSSKKGGFMSLGDNYKRNITASLVTEVYKDIPVEPLLQQLTRKSFQHHPTRGNEVRLDICTRGFWEAGQAAFFDVRFLNPNDTRYAKLELSKLYKVNGKDKEKYYNELIMQIEHGSFTPLVTTATGGMSREYWKFYARISEMISEKCDVNYRAIATWITRKITFSLKKSIGFHTRLLVAIDSRNQ